MANVYRAKHPEYRELEKVRDKERKQIKYNTDEEYRNKIKQRNNERYKAKIPTVRCCKSCNCEIEYKPRIVNCVDCYKKKTNWNKEPEFIKED